MSEFLENVQEDVSPLDHEELIENTVFLGEYPFDIILEGIQNQFSNYMNLEDKTNYVDIFYNQLHKSYNEIDLNDEDFDVMDDPEECKKILERFYDQFISKIRDLFNVRLAISIADLEDEEPDGPDVEYIVRRLYEFFILGAEINFKVVIGSDVEGKIKDISTDEREYFKTLNQLLEIYNPILTTISPTQFLQYRGEREIYDLFENGRVTGNFLRKYTPKLYQNEGFKIDLINYITSIHQFHKTIENSWKDIEQPATHPEETLNVPETLSVSPETAESITKTIPGLLSQINGNLGG